MAFCLCYQKVKNMQKTKAAFVDIDKTLLNGVTSRAIAYAFYRRKLIPLTFFVRLLFWYLRYKYNNLQDFSQVLAHALDATRDMPLDIANPLLQECFVKKIKPFFYVNFIKYLKELQKEGYKIFLVSSTIEPIAVIIQKYLKFDGVLATKPEICNNHYTGNILGEVCYGLEKKKRIQELNQQENFDFANSYTFSDHLSDLPMLELVKNPVVINPHGELKRIAKKRNWKILKFKELLKEADI